LRRIKAIRRKFAQEIGFLPPPVHIRDNLELPPSTYRITLKGVAVAEAECRAGMYLAINPGRATGTLRGTPTRDPAFGLPAQWIDGAERDHAQAQGYTVVDVGTVIATHLSKVVNSQAAVLLGRQEVQALLDQFAKTAPKFIEELTPKLLSLSVIHRVLQDLLAEGVHIRDLRTILETLADHATRTQDPVELAAAVRMALGRAIVQPLLSPVGELSVVVLDPELERVLSQVLAAAGVEGGALEPDLAETITREVGRAVTAQETAGHPPVLMVADRLRLALARLLRRAHPTLKVLAHGEIPDARTIRVHATIGGRR
jgi:flagellar biosynthesis protein FlhA